MSRRRCGRRGSTGRRSCTPGSRPASRSPPRDRRPARPAARAAPSPGRSTRGTCSARRERRPCHPIPATNRSLSRSFAHRLPFHDPPTRITSRRVSRHRSPVASRRSDSLFSAPWAAGLARRPSGARSEPGVAGSYCAKLFTDAGAEVLKVEPPPGLPCGTGPAVRSRRDATATPTARFPLPRRRAAQHRSPTSTTRRSTATVLELCRRRATRRRELPRRHLAARLGLTRCTPARSTVVSITPFGQDGTAPGDPTTTSCCRRSSGRSTSTATSDRRTTRGRRRSRRLGGGRLRSRRRARSPGPHRSGPAGANTSTCRAWSAGGHPGLLPVRVAACRAALAATLSSPWCRAIEPVGTATSGSRRSPSSSGTTSSP